jgi:sterol 3beta-glucosyltransferase
MMPLQDDAKKRVARKLTKRRKEGHQVTMEIPKRFEDGDDADEDCTAPKGQNMMLNQSVFGMIAAAGSQVDFNARFEGSEDEDDDTTPEDRVKPAGLSSESGASKASAEERSPRLKFHRRKLSESKLLRSLSHLGSRSRPKSTRLSTVLSDSATQDQKEDTEEQSTEMAEIDTTTRMPLKGPPIMSQMLEARAEAVQRKSFDARRSEDRLDQSDSSDNSASDILAKQLMEIFQFEKPEVVIDGKSHSSLFPNLAR